MMSRSVTARVKPDLLVWARESAGYSLSEAAKRLGIEMNRLYEWERGDDAPTISQLQALADAYKRPLAVFYLQERPRSFLAIRDFRRLPGENSAAPSPSLALEIRQAQQRRNLAIELLNELDEPPTQFRLA